MTQPRRQKHKGVYVHGEATKHRLIEAALDLFGRHGFDGASTRRIADEAGVNISMISYYFGNKEGLLVAVGEHIRDRMQERLAPVLEGLRHKIIHPNLPRDEALAALLTMMEALADIIIPESAETDRWARFIVRQEMEGGPALKVIRPKDIDRLAPMLVAKVRGTQPDDPENAIRLRTLIGQILVFRTSRASTLAAMGKKRLNKDDVAAIKAVIRQQARAALLARADTAASTS